MVFVPFAKLTVSPSFTLSAGVTPFTAKLRPLSAVACAASAAFLAIVTFWLVLCSCPPFTASFEPTATRPSVTPVILPVAASSLMLPTATLSNETSFFVDTVILLPACSTAMLSPAVKVTVSSGAIF